MSRRAVAAVTFDAAGTLLHPAEPVAQVYARHAAAHGGNRDAAAIGRAFAAAMRAARPLRATDPSWRRFWTEVIATTTGCGTDVLVDELFEFYARPSAWQVSTAALACMRTVRAAGLRIGVLSNWDLRLRGLLAGLGVDGELDGVVVSAECGLEKPDPRIFQHAARVLGVEPAAMLHAGDDEHDDVDGARAAGCVAWHVRGPADFAHLAAHLLGGGAAG